MDDFSAHESCRAFRYQASSHDLINVFCFFACYVIELHYMFSFMDEILLAQPFAKPDNSRRFVPLRIWWSIPDIVTVVTVPHTAPILSLQILRAGLQFKQPYARLHSPSKVRTRS